MNLFIFFVLFESYIFVIGKLSFYNFFHSFFHTERALKSVPTKAKSQVVLDCSRVKEFMGAWWLFFFLFKNLVLFNLINKYLYNCESYICARWNILIVCSLLFFFFISFLLSLSLSLHKTQVILMVQEMF